jgi:hypothetical protein
VTALKRKQPTRMKKLVCSKCKWACRANQTRIDEGLPTCHCGTPLKVAGAKRGPKPKPKKRSA